jgi:hypothetical protein
MLASSCQVPTLGDADKQYVQVGSFIRVRTTDCSVKQPSSGTPISGNCWGAGGIGSTPVCTISPPDSAQEDCSLWVGSASVNPASGGRRLSSGAGSWAGRWGSQYQSQAALGGSGSGWRGRFRAGSIAGVPSGSTDLLPGTISGETTTATTGRSSTITTTGTRCFCGALPNKLVIGLWGHHNHGEYADHLGMCGELVAAGDPGPFSGECSAVPPGEQCNV